MADLKQLETALVNADKAGDVDAAKMLASEIVKVRGQQQPEPSALDRAGRVAGLGVRSLIKIPLAVPTLLANGAAELVNLGITGANKLGANIDYRMQQPSTVLDRTLTQAGLPEPANATERFATGVTEAMGGAGGQAALAGAVAPVVRSPVWAELTKQFAANPGMQVLSAGGGAAGGDIARENDAGFWGQFAATVAGAAAPAVIKTGGAAAVRGVFRGGEEGRQTVENNLRTFKNAGTSPTVGQATEARSNRLAETMLSKTPGSAGVMVRDADARAANMGARADDLADSVSTNTGAANAGREVESGIKNWFNGMFKKTQDTLYSKLDQYIPPSTRVDISATKNTLDDLNADIPGAPTVSRFFKNAKINDIRGAVKADTEGIAGVESQLPVWQKALLDQIPKVQREATLQGMIDGKLPYEAVKKLRTLVGNEISNSSLVSDVPKSKWRAVYAALSDDLGNAAAEAGPDAQKAWIRANAHTRAGMQRMEFLDPIVGRTTPEDVFRAATSGMKEGGTTITTVMRSLPEKAQDALSATILKRMGIAKPGAQNDLGEIFSTETFLTNWNNISPDAKRALFSRYGTEYTKALDDLASTASNLRTGAKVFANPSGTEAALSTRLGISGIVLSTLMGHPGVAATIGGGMGVANVAARKLMTNPDFVKWLAQTTKAPAGALPGQIVALEQIANAQKPDDKRAIEDYAKALTVKAQELQQQPKRR